MSGTFEIPEELSAGARDLIKHLLTIDPLQRITAMTALQHPWLSRQSISSYDMNKLRYETTILISNKPEDDIDDQVMNELEAFGLSRSEMIRLIMTKTHSSISTLYYLLLDNIVGKRIHQGGAKRAVCAFYNQINTYAHNNSNFSSINQNQSLNQNTQIITHLQTDVPTVRPRTAVTSNGHNTGRNTHLYDATGALVPANHQYVLQQHQQHLVQGPQSQGCVHP